MRRILDLRITRWELKLVYALGAAALVWTIGGLAGSLDAPPVVGSLIGTPVLLGAYLLGARVFRGRGEAVAPPRPWWQMTARAKLSRRLGILFAAGVVVLIIGIGLDLAGVRRITVGGWPTSIVAVVENSVLAYLYLGSAIRLGRRERTAYRGPAAPTFKPKRLPLA